MGNEKDAEIHEILDAISNPENKKSASDTPQQPEPVQEQPITASSADNSKYMAIKAALQKQEATSNTETETKLESSSQEKPKKNTNASHSKKDKKSGSKKKKKKNSMFPQQGDSVFEVIRKMVFLLSSTVFIVCLFLIGKYFWENYQNNQTYEPIRHQFEKAEKKENTDNYEYYELLDFMKDLLATNSDVVGYINIPNKTGEEDKYPLSYPVVQRKNMEDGNAYYLDKDINQEYARAGSIFMDYRNYFDLVVNGIKQCDNSQNLIIYGHNMHDYAMFGSLKFYVNEDGYYENHPIIELYSNYRYYQYKIFGFIIVDIDDTTETAFDYWNTIDFADETEFYNYVNEIKRRTIRNTDVDVEYGDQILTLSTCNSTFSNGRLVVFARLLRDGEDLYEGTTSTPNDNVKWPNSYYKWHKNTYDPDAPFEPYG